MKPWLVQIPLVLSLCGCASRAPDVRASVDDGLTELADMMTGWFDSRDQAAADPDHYFEIRLVMLPIWHDREDGPWLYVEQASFAALDRPYRQRVYHLSRSLEGRYVSAVYTLPGDPQQYAGGWNDHELFDGIGPEDLSLRDGCSIVLRREDTGRFIGSSLGDGCPSSLSGASYATSEVVIESDRLVSWDRGWDAEGTQVWGATEGGYEFLKHGAGAP